MFVAGWGMFACCDKGSVMRSCRGGIKWLGCDVDAEVISYSHEMYLYVSTLTAVELRKLANLRTFIQNEEVPRANNLMYNQHVSIGNQIVRRVRKARLEIESYACECVGGRASCIQKG